MLELVTQRMARPRMHGALKIQHHRAIHGRQNVCSDAALLPRALQARSTTAPARRTLGIRLPAAYSSDVGPL